MPGHARPGRTGSAGPGRVLSSCAAPDRDRSRRVGPLRAAPGRLAAPCHAMPRHGAMPGQAAARRTARTASGRRGWTASCRALPGRAGLPPGHARPGLVGLGRAGPGRAGPLESAGRARPGQFGSAGPRRGGLRQARQAGPRWAVPCRVAPCRAAPCRTAPRQIASRRPGHVDRVTSTGSRRPGHVDRVTSTGSRRPGRAAPPGVGRDAPGRAGAGSRRVGLLAVAAGCVGRGWTCGLSVAGSGGWLGRPPAMCSTASVTVSELGSAACVGPGVLAEGRGAVVCGRGWGGVETARTLLTVGSLYRSRGGRVRRIRIRCHRGRRKSPPVTERP